MPRIHSLPPEVFTKIAAGEVIERPASVVKELLENAVDAGATRIDVDIEQGGVDLIRVVDNGCGMEVEDLPLAFVSHATSKLGNADDLFHVQTLGFRGEALASIGSVAQVALRSRPPGAEVGGEIRCEGGALTPVIAWNGTPGTCLEVRNLFFNTPVRRRFLRTTATEMGHIAEAVLRLALAVPGLQLTLRHNGKMVYEVHGSAGLKERLRMFFGPEIVDKLLPVDASAGPARLFGFVADPGCDRGNARMQYVFVNRRWVRDRSLGHALQEAYRGLLMTGRYAVAFLFLEMPPDLVDVNVHPTKSEVRFRDAQALYHLILTTIRERLRNADLTASLQPPPFRQASSPVLRPAGPPAFAATQVPLPQPPAGAVLPNTASPPSTDQPPTSAPPSLGGERPVRAIQVHDAYLVLETPEGVLVIDQHALHERVLYEAWRARVRAGDVECQQLLVPEPVDLPAEQATVAVEHKQVLQKLGLGVEDFGGSTVLVTSYPAMLRNGTPGQMLRSAVEFLTTKDRPPSADQLMDDLLKLLACRAAIKAGDPLNAEEISSLVAQRHLADDTHHCPHGRPTALFLSKQDLDRQFKRV